MAKSRRPEQGRPYLRTFNHCDVIGQQSKRILWKTQNEDYYTVPRHRGGINRKPVCDFILVINSNWHPTSYRFGVSATGLNFGHCLWTSYDVHFGLIGKHVVDFLLIELLRQVFYSWDAMGENRQKIGDFAPTQSVWPKISGRRAVRHQPFLNG